MAIVIIMMIILSIIIIKQVYKESKLAYIKSLNYILCGRNRHVWFLSKHVPFVFYTHYFFEHHFISNIYDNSNSNKNILILYSIKSKILYNKETRNITSSYKHSLDNRHVKLCV